MIDGNSLLNRAFYATPVFTTRAGLPTNAVFGFVKLLFKILNDKKPKYIIVVFDMKAPTFRHMLYDGYKATRKSMPDDLAVQLGPLKNLLKAMKIATCEKEGIEADDILGTLSKKFDVHSFIYTGDRDSYQLVDEKTNVCYTKRGVSDILELNADNFSEVNGLTPERIIDLKALMGDSSDNIPGVPGIGEKTARDLLNRFGTLKGIYENLNELGGAVKVKLEANKQLAELSYKLAQIDRNCDLNVSLESCVVPKTYNMEVKRIFGELEFKSLLGLNIFTDDEKSPATENIPEVVVCRSFSDISEKLSEVSEFSVVLGDDVACIYADKEYCLKMGRIDENCIDYDDFIKFLNIIYSNKKNTVIAYDFKKQMHILESYGIKVECNFEALSVIMHLCDNGIASENLKTVCELNGFNYDYPAFAVKKIYDLYSVKLNENRLSKLYNDIEKPLLVILYDMERAGIKISFERLNELSGHYLALINEYRDKVFESCGQQFNLNSPSQLGRVLYEKLGIKEIKKKNSEKYTTGAEVLEKLVDEYPVAGDILKFRLYQKLNSTYIEGFRHLANKQSGLIHTTFHQTVTSTGRLSSSEPNLQNIPVREEEGRELRKLFVPHDGNVFIDADYSQIELRLLAHFSGCKELIDAFNSETDIHALTASQVFGVPVGEVTPKMRRAAKAVNFGIIYGISDFGLSRNLNISVSTAKSYIEKYFNTYSAVKEYMKSNVDFARENGYVSTLAGRKRVIPEINSANYNLRQFGERAAMNMPLQGSSADIIKIAMLGVVRELEKAKLRTKLILQVHDELILEAPEEEVAEASIILKKQMENAVELKVPLTVGVSTGKSWYDAK